MPLQFGEKPVVVDISGTIEKSEYDLHSSWD